MIIQGGKRVVFFRESRDLLSFAELFKCNFPQGSRINLVPRVFRLPTRGSGRPILLVGRRKTLGTRLEWDRAQKWDKQYTRTALALKSLELISPPILNRSRFTRHVMLSSFTGRLAGEFPVYCDMATGGLWRDNNKLIITGQIRWESKSKSFHLN